MLKHVFPGKKPLCIGCHPKRGWNAKETLNFFFFYLSGNQIECRKLRPSKQGIISVTLYGQRLSYLFEIVCSPGCNFDINAFNVELS